MADARTAITVGDIAGQLDLRITVLAGERGLDRSVSWAHVCDTEHPWDWLDPDVLLMTSGWIIPTAPDEQRAFVERSASAGFTGVILGDDVHCPPISDAMIEAANRAGFPLMMAHRQTSWIEIARIVVRANQTREGRTLNIILRLHEKVAAWLSNPGSGDEFLQALGAVVGYRIHVVEADTWEPLFPRTAVPDRAWSGVLLKAVDDSGPNALGYRLEFGERTALAVAIPVERTAAYVIIEGAAHEAPRLAVFQHVAAACALEIARVDAAFHAEWWRGSAIFAEALQGHLQPAVFGASLEDRGIEPPFLCLALDIDLPAADRLDRYWLVREIPHLFARSGVVSVLIHADDARIRELRALSTRDRYRVGVSEPFPVLAALSDASHQARWALETIAPGGFGVALYGATSDTFLPRTLLESRRAVDRILAPLIEYDEAHGSELVRTLQTYLDCDRSPKQAAARLHVHNQTIHYRLARIQELTGRSLRSTADISDLWFALRALALSQTAPATG